MATAIPLSLGNQNLTVSVASGDALDVREFQIEEGVSRLFEVALRVVSQDPDADFETTIGGPARFEIHRVSPADGETRHWSGVCSRIEQIEVEEDGLSTYVLHIVPTLWLATQRRNYRIFQDQSELDAAMAILAEWGITPRLELSEASYEKRRYRVQYAESDFDFVSRMLEDIGVAYHFEQSGEGTQLVLVDAPNRRAARVAVPFLAQPNERTGQDWVTGLRTQRQVRPGKYTQSDVDYRRALDYPLSASASGGVGIEASLERYHHNYGAFLWKAQGEGTPVADDRGAARTSEAAGQIQVNRRLEAQRVEGRGATFRTSAHDIRPGKVITIVGHPRAEIGAAQLVVACRLTGTTTGDWQHWCETRYADSDYRPELVTAKPRTLGVESATVTGPAGEEIHTDEFGRIRVHFHWDRQGAADQTSSCWIPVSQPSAGAGFGAISLPRVGQEVVIDFLGEDPDRPVVLGSVFTQTTPPPYELPKYKMVSGMRSESYPRPKPKGASRMGGGPVVASVAMTYELKTPRDPLGGGIAPAGLGGGDTVPTGGSPSLQQIMPGLFGADQAGQGELQDAVDKMRAPGPDGQDAGRSSNDLITDDSSGTEQLYLQGQHDLRIVVKNNLVGGVGGNRAFTVLGNDYEGIVGYQATKVGRDREIEVGGIEMHTVQGEVLDQGQANRMHVTKQSYTSITVEGSHGFNSKTYHRLAVGESTAIHMSADSIAIDSTKVYINPGRELVDAAMNGVEPNALVAAQQREARIAKAMEAIAAHEMDSRFSSAVKENSLRATGRGAPTPFSEAIRRAGVTDPGEIRESAQRMAEIMYGPP